MLTEKAAYNYGTENKCTTKKPKNIPQQVYGRLGADYQR